METAILQDLEVVVARLPEGHSDIAALNQAGSILATIAAKVSDSESARAVGC